MTITLELSPELEARLRAEAARRGLSMKEQQMSSALKQNTEARPRPVRSGLPEPQSWPG